MLAFMKTLSLFIFVLAISFYFSPILYAEEMDHSQHKMDNQDQKKMSMENMNMDMDMKGMDHSQHMMHMQGDMKNMMHHDGHHNMTLDDDGMVMNSNDSELPRDCSSISKVYDITVRAGIKYAYPFPGTIFGFDQHEIKVIPCSKINFTFINEDEIRHQWMMHGLPKYIYDQGMFHLEAAGGAQKSGSIIVPSDDKTYLIHCDITQHMEKGMKAQLVVGKGSGDLPSIPGISGAWERPN